MLKFDALIHFQASSVVKCHILVNQDIKICDSLTSLESSSKEKNMNWKILIVDDDPTIHKLITKRFLQTETGQSSYQVTSVFEAVNAVPEVKKIRPDLVILDLMMPKVSGIEICQEIKSDPETKDILILILSAKDSQDDRIRGLKIGADDYISKPFHLASLLRKIEYMLSKKVI